MQSLYKMLLILKRANMIKITVWVYKRFILGLGNGPRRIYRDADGIKQHVFTIKRVLCFWVRWSVSSEPADTMSLYPALLYPSAGSL